MANTPHAKKYMCTYVYTLLTIKTASLASMISHVHTYTAHAALKIVHHKHSYNTHTYITQIHTCIHTYVHTYINTHIHTYTTYTHFFWLLTYKCLHSVFIYIPAYIKNYTYIHAGYIHISFTHKRTKFHTVLSYAYMHHTYIQTDQSEVYAFDAFA